MRLDVLEKEMLAGIEQAKGERQAAAVHARDASDLEAEMPFAFGPPFIDWPSAEFLGDALLDARKITDAADAYRLSLERAHLRSRSLLGLLNTQVRLGEGAKARYTLEQLRIIWRKADPPVKRQLEEAAKGLDDTDSRIVADETASEQNWTVIKPPADTDAESAIPSDQPLSPESSGGGRFTTDPTQDSM